MKEIKLSLLMNNVYLCLSVSIRFYLCLSVPIRYDSYNSGHPISTYDFFIADTQSYQYQSILGYQFSNLTKIKLCTLFHIDLSFAFSYKILGLCLIVSFSPVSPYLIEYKISQNLKITAYSRCTTLHQFQFYSNFTSTNILNHNLVSS